MDSNQVEASMTQTRPSTAGLIELHVYFVPEDLWNSKLNKVSTDVINKFISVGFIRVSPEMRLRTLRERLGEFLGDDAVIERFVFLKSVGRSLAVVKAKQEQELKLKAFVPPYAIQPELYLLPGADNEGSTYGSSITPEEHQYIPEYIGIDGSGPRRLNIPERDQTLHNEQKLPLHIDREQTLHPEPTHSIQLDRDQTLHTERSQPLYTERDRPLVKETLYSEKVPPLQTDALNKENTKNSPIYSHEENIAEPFKWTSKEQEVVPNENLAQYHTQVQQQEEHLSPRRKEKIPISNLKQKENENVSKENKRLPGRNTARDSGIPESLGGRETEHPQRKRKELKSKNTVKSQTGRYNDQFGDNSPRDLPEPAQYLSPPPPPPVPAFPTINSPTPKSQSHRESVVEQLNRLKEERLQLEKSREELVKKTKSLLEQYKLRRYQARDSWKKKYFETKKATSVLEETLNKLRTDLELYYQKLLTQLAARDSKKRIKYPTLAGSTKNAAIMQITKKQHEIDQLKRKLENARTKLMIEIKMRKQASSDLNVLKAELAQKKAQAVLTLTPVFAL